MHYLGDRVNSLHPCSLTCVVSTSPLLPDTGKLFCPQHTPFPATEDQGPKPEVSYFGKAPYLIF